MRGLPHEQAAVHVERDPSHVARKIRRQVEDRPGEILRLADPAQAARALVDGGYTASYDYALEALTGIPYGRWREFDVEDTVRFYSLRLQEAGMSKSTPDQIMQRGTNWQYFNELKQELKA